MLGSSGLPTFPIDVVSGQGIDVTRQGTTFRFDLNDGTIRTGGADDLFTVATPLGNTVLRAGFSLSIVANRSFSGEAFLRIDATASKAWLDVEGKPLARVIAGRIYRINFDPLLDAFRSTAPVLVENDDFAPSPDGTLKGNIGGGIDDLTVGEVRTLLEVDRLPNKSEEEMVAEGAIADALAEKASPADLDAKLAPIIADVATKATPADIDTKLVPVIAAIATKATSADIADAVGPVITNLNTLQAFVAPIPPRITALESAQRTGFVSRATYAEAAALTLNETTTYSVSETDTGTHAGSVTEMGYSGGQVPNSGTFAAIPNGTGGPLVLRRVGTGGNAAVPTLILDNNKLRETRYVSRPGENLRGWTSRIDLVGDAATPLAVGGGYNTTNTTMGDAIAITGSAPAGPIALTRVEPGKVYRWEIPVLRTVADAANQNVAPRVRAFSNTKADLGTLIQPSRSILVTDPFVFLSFTICTVAGKADVLFPDPAGGWMRPYITTQGANGVINVPYITQPAIPADFAASLAAAAGVTLPVSTDKFVMQRGADGAPVLFSFADFEAYMAGPTTYVWPAHVELNAAENTEVIPLDTGLKKVDVYNIGAGRVYLRDGGQPAGLRGDGSVPVDPDGGLWSPDLLEPGAISAIAEAPTKLTIKFLTTTNYNVAARASANQYIDRIRGRGIDLTAPQEAALREYYSALYSAGVFNTLGCFYNLRVPNAAKWMNLCNIKGIFADYNDNIGLTLNNWKGVVFDGATGWVNTKLKLANMAEVQDYSLLCYPQDATAQGSSRCAIGDGTTTMVPARTPTTMGFRDQSNTFVVVTGTTAGPGLLSTSRTEADRLRVRQKKTFSQDVLDPVGTGFADRHITIGVKNTGPTGGNAVPEAGSYLIGPHACFGAGRHLTDTMHNVISDATDALVAATEAF